MAVTLRNTPLAVTQLGTSTTISLVSTYNGTTPVAGDFLVAVLMLQGNTSTTLGATPTGWTLSGINIAATSGRSAVYTRTATGTSADNAPTWPATCANTLADCAGEIVLYIFDDPSGATPYLYSFGTATGTSGTVAPVTSTTIPVSGCYALAGNSAYGSTAGTITWTTPAAPATWTSDAKDAATSQNYHYAFWHLAGWPKTNATLTCSMAHTVVTTTHEAAFVLVVAPAPGLPPPPQPGSRTWIQRFRRTQAEQPAPPPPPPIVAVPSFSSGQPAGVRVIQQRAGAAQATPVTPAVAAPPPQAVFYPLNHALRAPKPLAYRKGSAATMQALPQDYAGPPVTPLRGPVRARQPLGLPPRGRTAGRAGVFTSTAPVLAVFYPARHPIAAVTRPLPIRGRTASRSGIFGQAGSPVTPLQRPVSARSRKLPPRGRTASQPGFPQPAGSVFYPFRQPVTAKIRVLPRRGRTASNPGVFDGTGTVFTQLRRPVRARFPLPARGRAQGRAGFLTPAGFVQAVFYPLNHPAAAVVRPLQARGRTAGRAGVLGTPGSQFYPLNHPVRIRPALPPRGRTAGRAGTFTSVAPVLATFYPLTHPAAAVIRPLPTRGRSTSRAGVYGQAGPPVTPLQRPARIRPSLPPRGRAQWRYGVFTPPASVTVFYPAVHPAGAVVRPLPIRGRTAGRAGVYGNPGVPLVQLRRPVAAVIRVPVRRGRNYSNPGTFGAAGSQFYPLRHPVAPQGRGLPPRGRAAGRAGVFTPVVNPGPPFYPLRRPASAVTRPGPVRGRAQGHAGVFAGSGPSVKPLQHPVYAWRPGPRRGVCLTSIRPPAASGSGSKFYPFRRPVQSRQPLPRRGQRWTGPPYVPPFVPAGGHGYPYTAMLAPARWAGFLIDGEWAASMAVPVRYYAMCDDARWPSQTQPGRWNATNGPA